MGNIKIVFRQKLRKCLFVGWVVFSAVGCSFNAKLENTGSTSITSTSQINFAITSQNVNEGAGSGSIIINLSKSQASTVTVLYSVSSSTAVSGTDYSLSNGSVTFNPGEISKTISFSVLEDSTVESSESFTVTLGSISNDQVSLGSKKTHTVNIVDNDYPALAIDSLSANEGSTAIFTITLSAASSMDVAVDWATVAGTATSGTHYTSASGTAVIYAGQSSVNVSVSTIHSAGVCDTDKVFTIHLSNPTNATISVNDGTGTIVDTDLPSLSVASNSGAEGTSVSVVATLSGTCSTKAVTFLWSNSSGTAISGTDFTAKTSQTGTISAGQTSVNLVNPTTHDTIYEGDETFTVTISSPTNAILGSPTSSTVTINEDDSIPTSNFVASSQNVNEGGGTGTATLTLSNASATATTIPYTVTTSGATSGTDFILANGSVTFPVGNTSQNISFSLTDDAIVEGVESFTITLGSPTSGSATLGTTASHTVNITDNDSATLSINSVNVNEGSVATFTVTLSTTIGSNVTVDWATADGTGTSGTHYTAASGTATILSGQTTTTFNVSTLQTSGICDVNRNFTVHLSNPTNASISINDGEGTIRDIDLPVLTVANASITEGSSGNVVASLSAACPTKNVTFSWENSSGTASSASDFTGVSSQTGTITAGQTTVNLSNSTTQDSIYEGNEIFYVSISSPTNATLGAQTTSTVTLVENDTAPTLSVANVSVTEGNQATVTVTLSAASGVDTSFHWSTANGTALSGTNYTGVSDTVKTIVAGQTTASLVIDTLADNIYAASKTFTATISSPTNATLGSPTAATVTVLNQDLPSRPSALTLTSPSTQPGSSAGNVTTPTIQVAGVTSGNLVKIFTDSGCTTQVGSATASAATIDIISSSLTEGAYDFYATQTDSFSLTSNCSTAKVNYVLDLTNPTNPSSLSLGTVPFNLTDSPTLSWTSSSDANGIAQYQRRVIRASDSSVVSTWTAITSGSSVTGLTLVNGDQYYFELRAVDNAGNQSSTVTSSNWTATSVSFPVIPQFVQSKVATAASGASLAASFTSNNQVGSLIVVACHSSTTTDTLTVDDSRSNTYSSADSQSRTTAGKIHVFYAANVSAGGNTVTCHSSSSTIMRTQIVEYKNVATSSPLDVTGVANGSSTTATASLTTTQSNTLVVKFTRRAGGTILGAWDPHSLMRDDGLVDRLAPTAAAQSMTDNLSSSAPWVTVMAAFKTAGGTTTSTGIYTFGGVTFGNTFLSKVLRSDDDGVRWNAVGKLPAVTEDYCAVTYDNSLWVIGGYNGSAVTTAVYKSTDGGLNWTTAGNIPEARDLHVCLVYNNKMWLIGGSIDDAATTAGYRSTVYSSTDGATWTNVGNIPAVRYQHRGVVFNNKMWIIGGRDSSNAYVSTVWWSTDGITWSTTNTSALPAARANGGLAVFNNEMWWVAGTASGGSASTSVYSCGDPCSSWTTRTNYIENFENGGMVANNGKLITGFGTSYGRVNSTSDGSTWTQTYALPQSDLLQWVKLLVGP